MILKRLKLINYGGIYNGMGLYEIEIDFTKCMHKIILIKGDNGSGKSTIESSLKPLPDDSSSFIDGMTASKEIEYYDEFKGVLYSIKYIHEWKNESRISKGYFFKTNPNGNVIDLNPSGNISNCKEAVNEELELDSNYIALTQLSSVNRGIADLRPSERKKFVNNILSTTDVYNNMYKSLSKKSSHFKSLMTSISSKIDSIGNVAQLEEELKSVENRIKEAEVLIEQHSEVINKEKGMLLSIDPDNQLRDRISIFSEKRKEYTSEKDSCNKKLNSIYMSNPNLVTMVITQDMIDNLDSDITNTEYEIKSLKDKITSLIESREKDAASLEEETVKLKSIDNGSSIIELERMRNKYTSDKKEIESRWGEIVDLKNITRDEFMIAFETIKSMADMIAHLQTIIPESELNKAYISAVNSLESVSNEIEELVSFRNTVEMNEYKLDTLNQRPSSCTDNTCPFITDALKAKAILDELLKSRQEHKENLKELKMKKESIEQLMADIDTNKQLLVLYNSNSIILRKLNLGIGTYDECITVLKSRLYEIVSILRGLIDYSNDLAEYKVIDENLSKIETKWDSLNSQRTLIDMISSTIDKINRQLSEDNDRINAMNNDIVKKSDSHNNMVIMYNAMSEVFVLRANISECEESLRMLDEEIEKDKSNIDRIEKLNSDIEKLTVNISELKTQLEPLKKKSEELKYKINISGEYYKEYEDYNALYSKIEILKYHCSPTTGIQLLFTEMYLGKIIENANNILSRLFGGIFALQRPIISSTEFKIPVAVSGGINHDDITSMSSAQIALISMIISISLLSQTSTKLNIIVGDEIDAPLDSENRREFLGTLLYLMELVQSSQCVLISHNSEIPMNECDIILLKNESDVITDGNIIWSYK